MIRLTHTKLNVGLKHPVKILHITDVHVTYANENDTPRHQRGMEK